MTELSPTTKALLRTARNDGPGAAARAKILGKIASGTGALGGTSLGTAAKGTLAAGSAKLLVAGALFGSAVTVGIAAMMLHIGTPKLAPDPTYAVQADTELASIAPATHGMVIEQPVPTKRVVATVGVKHADVLPEQEPELSYDPLAREAALVAEARSAIIRGEPDVALGALRATETLPTRAMEPEELSLEARALHAAGRHPEAAFVEEQLRARFPDNALTR